MHRVMTADGSLLEDVDMNTDAPATSSERGNDFILARNKKQKQAKAARIQKSSRHKKPRNQIVFSKTGKAKASKGGKR